MDITCRNCKKKGYVDSAYVCKNCGYNNAFKHNEDRELKKRKESENDFNKHQEEEQDLLK